MHLAWIYEGAHVDLRSLYPLEWQLRAWHFNAHRIGALSAFAAWGGAGAINAKDGQGGAEATRVAEAA